MVPEDSAPTKRPGVFAAAYGRMMELWPNSPGSVDDELWRNAVFLTPELADGLYRAPGPPRYVSGSRPQLERFVADAVCDSTGPGQPVVSLTEAVFRWAEEFEQSPAGSDLEHYTFGGTEEDLVRRGSGNCAEVARLACILFQVAGLPSRMGFLADTEQAYCGHVVCEAFRNGLWGAVDPRTNVVYRHPDGRPASLWHLSCSDRLVEQHAGPGRPYTYPGQFRAVALSSYEAGDTDRYDYTESAINDYVKAIWKMADAGWPGGFRWLFGEDEED